MGKDTMIVGSPEHKAFQRDQISMAVDAACNQVADEGVFSIDQVEVLRDAFRAFGAHLKKVI
ncbi:MAG: hypothetical protein AAFR68_04190 [Pseudomonadota bacterium]